jgi:hypothetical protein
MAPASSYTQHRGDMAQTDKATEKGESVRGTGPKRKKKKRKTNVFVDDKDNLDDLVI